MLLLLSSPFFALAASALPVRMLLGVHITAGTIALLAGLIPMLGRKGGSRHVRAGRLYVYCMITVAVTAVLLCLFQPITLGRLFLTGVAVLSFYLSFSGWRAARRHSAVLPAPDLLLGAVSALVGLVMVVAGIWLQAVLFAFFGGLICLFAGLDVWRGLRPMVATPAPWLFLHFTRMGGSYISATTAFIVVNLGRWLPATAPSWVGLVGWLAPTLLGSVLIACTVRYYKRKFQSANPAPSLAPAQTVSVVLLLVLASSGFAPQAAGQASSSRLLTGLITDTAGQPLPYATVGVLDQGVGTVADAQGQFRLTLPPAVVGTDSLRFALLGYGARTFAVAALPAAPLTVALPTTSVALTEVTIRVRGLDSARIGNRHYRTNLQTNFALGGQAGLNVGSEIGRVFQLPKRGAWLDQFEFVLSANDFDSVQLRVNVYQLRGGVPTTSLLQRPVYKQLIGKGSRRVRVDLRPLNLFVTDDAVAITIEWVGHSRQGKELALPLLMPAFATHLYRYGAANTWRRFPSMSTTMELIVRH